MRKFFGAAFVLISVLVLWSRCQERSFDDESSPSLPVAYQAAPTEHTPAEQSIPNPSVPSSDDVSGEKNETQDGEVEMEAPEAASGGISPFSLRQLDLPKPASIEELLEGLKPFERPKLPYVESDDRSGMADGDVLTLYRGYYEAGDEKYRRIEILRAADAWEVWLEDKDGGGPRWTKRAGELEFWIFGNDPYGLINGLPDGRKLYLKFFSWVPVEGLPGLFRVKAGWLIRDRTKSSGVAMIDGAHYELEIPGEPGEYEWPTLEVIKKLMFKPLPAK